MTSFFITQNYGPSPVVNKIDSVQGSFLWQIVRTRSISNTRLYNTCGVEPWSKTIRRQRLTKFGNHIRLLDSATAKKALPKAPKKFKKLHGGQPLTWLKAIAKDFNINTEKPFKKFTWIGYNRRQYEELVDSVMSKATYPSSTESESED